MKQLAEELKAVVEAGGEHRGKRLLDVSPRDWIGLTVKATVDTISGFVRSSKEDRWLKKGWTGKIVQIGRGPSDTSVPRIKAQGQMKAAFDKRYPNPGNYTTDISPHDWVVI